MIIHISGKTRRGKTSLAVAMVMDYLTGVDDERYINSCNYIKNLQKQGYNVSLPPQHHIVSANINIEDKYPNVKAYKVSGFKLGLPLPEDLAKEDKFKNVQTERLIPHGVYLLDECAKYYKYKELPPWVLRMYELSGQYFLLFLLISHRYIGINKDLRALIDKFIYVVESMHTYIVNGKTIKQRKYREDGKLIKTVWTYYEFEDEGDLEQFLQTTTKEKSKIGKKCTYTFNGDIKSHYDPYNFKKAFENHPNDFSYSSKEEIDNYLEPKTWAVGEK